MQFIKQLYNFESSDPDEARRKKLLNTLLTGIFAAAFVGSIITLILVSLNVVAFSEVFLIFSSSLIIAIGTIIIFFINRWSGKLASWLFLVLFTIALSFSDTPDQLANGRSLFVYAIPIAISSLILIPPASFIFSALSSAIITYLAISVSITPNIPGIIGFFILALVSWLSSRSLENALRDLRVINANLDRIVAERTQALVESLTREQIEAGRSQAILESIADGVVVYDLHGKAIQANPA